MIVNGKQQILRSQTSGAIDLEIWYG